MKVHVISTTSAQSNIDIDGVFPNRADAIGRFTLLVSLRSKEIHDDDPEIIKSDDQWSYMPDDTNDSENVSVRVQFNVPLFGELVPTDIGPIGWRDPSSSIV